ncbi:hypothetical protein Hanom_Chr06g00558621 [Helianthus anomalus]
MRFLVPLSLKRLTEGLKPTRSSEDNEIYKIFTNVMCLHPPKEEDPLRVFNKQIDEDTRIVMSRSNINELQKVYIHMIYMADDSKSKVKTRFRWLYKTVIFFL